MKRVLRVLALLIPTAAAAQPLPDATREALRVARVPANAMSAWVAPVDGGPPILRWQADRPRNPASLAKLVVAQMALEQLGPAWRWRTPVWVSGRLDGETGRLDGDVAIAGRGDPSLTIERLWLLMHALRRQGVREIGGDVVLDSSAFEPSARQPVDFDGEPWRPGNVQPDALIFNFKSVTLHLRPDPAAGVAWVSAEMPLAQRSVPLRPGPCIEARAQLRANWATATAVPAAPLRLDGSWPTACGEHRWPLADPDPASYNARLWTQVWTDMGGSLVGRVRSGNTDALPQALSFEWTSPPLAELLRDMNKFSSNLYAEQLALSLAWQQGERPATAEGARRGVLSWAQQALPWPEDGVVWDRASGLSRETRLSARQLAHLLARAWAAPTMPEFVAALPVAGVDGTLAREPGRFGDAVCRAHLKTGSLRDVVALAGYVQARSGKRRLLVAIVNHPRAEQARPALDALVRWAVDD